MPRLVYLAGVGIALVGLALAATDAALEARPGVTEANVRRIRPGMTMREVNALLGTTPRAPYVCAPVGTPAAEYTAIWRDEAGEAWIFFTDVDTVYSVERFRPTRMAGPLARLRAWLGW